MKKILTILILLVMVSSTFAAVTVDLQNKSWDVFEKYNYQGQDPVWNLWQKVQHWTSSSIPPYTEEYYSNKCPAGDQMSFDNTYYWTDVVCSDANSYLQRTEWWCPTGTDQWTWHPVSDEELTGNRPFVRELTWSHGFNCSFTNIAAGTGGNHAYTLSIQKKDDVKLSGDPSVTYSIPLTVYVWHKNAADAYGDLFGSYSTQETDGTKIKVNGNSCNSSGQYILQNILANGALHEIVITYTGTHGNNFQYGIIVGTPYH